MVLDRTVLAHRTATGVGVEGLEAATGLAAIASATGLARVGAFALGMGEATSALITFGGQLGVISLAIYELARIADWGGYPSSAARATSSRPAPRCRRLIAARTRRSAIYRRPRVHR